MKRKLIGALTAALALGATLVAAPTPVRAAPPSCPGFALCAAPTQKRLNLDCGTNGSSWSAWQYLPYGTGAGKLCGEPRSQLQLQVPTRTLDNRSDGQCISAYFQINQGATVYLMSGTTVCGIGYVGSGHTPNYPVYDVYVGRHSNGSPAWSSVNSSRRLVYIVE